jgi:DNA-binding protein WhiA
MCRVPLSRRCCTQAESYGALLLGSDFRAEGLRIVTSHEAYARRLPALFQTAFGFLPEAPADPVGGGKWVFALTEPEKVRVVRAAYGYDEKPSVVLHLNNAVLESDCCLAAFWRGAFCSGGTVTDPMKKYLLEIVTTRRVLARELSALLRESGFEAVPVARGGVQVLSLNLSEAIEDFLTLCGAPVCAMDVMEAKLEKGLRNNVNRRVNCDTANLDKTLAAAERLRGVIARLDASGRLDELPEALRATARVRLENPEDSLSQLAERLGIGKSCLNHRLRKLQVMDKG